MYCKQCGKELSDNAMFCKYCGVSKGVGNSYCYNCGSETEKDFLNCPNCGAALLNKQNSNPVNGEPKSKIVAGILGILLGGLGIHNFYLGYISKGLWQLLLSVLSCGFFSPIVSVWGLIEGILILTDKINKDGNGNPLIY